MGGLEKEVEKENREGGKKKSSEANNRREGERRSRNDCRELRKPSLWVRLPSFFTTILIGSKHLRPSKGQHTRQ